MQTFKSIVEDQLSESISIVDGQLVFDYNDDQKKGTSTKFGKRKTKKGEIVVFNSSPEKFQGVTVYTVYKTAKKSADILRALKKKNNINLTQKDYEQFLKRTAAFISGKTTGYLDKESVIGLLNNVDVIVTPQTSSFLLKDILDQISSIKPHIKIIHEAFVKTNVDDIVIDYADFNVSDAVKNRMKQLMSEAKKQGYIEINKVPKTFLNYLSNVLNLNQTKVLQKYIDGQNVVIFDDILGSGFTMKEMILSMKMYSPNSIHGITLFKT